MRALNVVDRAYEKEKKNSYNYLWMDERIVYTIVSGKAFGNKNLVNEAQNELNTSMNCKIQSL